MRYIIADVDDRIGTHPLTKDLVAGIRRGQGMTDIWIEGNVDGVVEGLKKTRDEAELEAMDTAS